MWDPCSQEAEALGAVVYASGTDEKGVLSGGKDEKAVLTGDKDAPAACVVDRKESLSSLMILSHEGDDPVLPKSGEVCWRGNEFVHWV